MNNKNLTTGLAVVAIIAIIALFVPNQPVKNKLGSQNISSASYSRPVTGDWTAYDNILVGEFFATGSSTINGALAIGSGSTKISGENFGNCNLYTGGTGAPITLAASTTIQLDCQAANPKMGEAQSGLAGVLANDIVFLHAPTTTPVVGVGTTNGQNGGGVTVLGYSASTTAGYISVLLHNGTGALATLASSTIRNWQYLVIR